MLGGRGLCFEYGKSWWKYLDGGLMGKSEEFFFVLFLFLKLGHFWLIKQFQSPLHVT